MLSMRTVISKRFEDVPSLTISKTQLLAADELGPHLATPPAAYFKARSFSACTYLPLNLSPPPPPGSTPYDGLYGEAPPERGIFFRLQVYEGVAIS